MNCPICKSNTSIFPVSNKLYIIDDDDSYYTQSMYICNKCKIVFTFSNNIDHKPDTSNNIKKVQNIFNDVSKSCNKILENIK